MLTEEEITQARATLDELKVEHRDLNLNISPPHLYRIRTSFWCIASRSANSCSRIRFISLNVRWPEPYSHSLPERASRTQNTRCSFTDAQVWQRRVPMQ